MDRFHSSKQCDDATHADVVLLGGSTKKRQSAAIGAAADAWTDYKRRKPAR